LSESTLLVNSIAVNRTKRIDTIAVP